MAALTLNHALFARAAKAAAATARVAATAPALSGAGWGFALDSPALAVLLALVAAIAVGALVAIRPRATDGASLPSVKSVALLTRSRRSIFPKDYSGAKVPREAVQRALEAANWAPTHGKTEPWRFVVFEGAAAITRLLALKREGITTMVAVKAQSGALEKAAMKEKELHKCSLIIAICCKRVANAKGTLMPEWEEQAACACAVQNLHLSLHAEGYVGYWSSGGVGGGWADAPVVRDFLGMDGECLGATDTVLGFFHVGVAPPKTVASYKARRGPLADKVRWIAD